MATTIIDLMPYKWFFEGCNFCRICKFFKIHENQFNMVQDVEFVKLRSTNQMP